MNKTEFLNELKNQLVSMPEQDINDILYDYEEHFRIGMEQGKTEEEIASSLGDAKMIAKQFKTDFAIREAEQNISAGNIFKAVLAAVGMGFFNLVFVLGPFLGLLGILFGLFAASIGITVGGLGGLLAIILSPLMPSLINIGVNYAFAISTCIGLACLGTLFFIGNCYIAKFFYKATIGYLKWNAEIITSRRS